MRRAYSLHSVLLQYPLQWRENWSSWKAWYWLDCRTTGNWVEVVYRSLNKINAMVSMVLYIYIYIYFLEHHSVMLCISRPKANYLISLNAKLQERLRNQISHCLECSTIKPFIMSVYWNHGASHIWYYIKKVDLWGKGTIFKLLDVTVAFKISRSSTNKVSTIWICTKWQTL